ncbi:MAG: divergent PAP2 family protein [Clostridia bacterium]
MSIFALSGFKALQWVVIAAISGWLISQLFKAVLNTLISKNYSQMYFIKSFFSDGDFPSSHTCFSLSAYIVGMSFLIYAMNCSSSVSEAICICGVISIWSIFEFVIIKDSVSVRGTLKKTNIANKEMCDHMSLNAQIYCSNSTNTKSLQEFWSSISNGININVGHMPHEVIGGVFLGLFIGLGISFSIWENSELLKINNILFFIYIVITTYTLTHKEKVLAIIKKIKKK